MSTQGSRAGTQVALELVSVLVDERRRDRCERRTCRDLVGERGQSLGEVSDSFEPHVGIGADVGGQLGPVGAVDLLYAAVLADPNGERQLRRLPLTGTFEVARAEPFSGLSSRIAISSTGLGCQGSRRLRRPRSADSTSSRIAPSAAAAATRVRVPACIRAWL